MLFSVPVGVSNVSYAGVNYPATSGIITVPDVQSTAALAAAFALAGVVPFFSTISASGLGLAAVATSGKYSDIVGGPFNIDVVAMFGAYCDGTSHPISATVANTKFPSLALPNGTGNVEYDWAAIQHSLNALSGHITFAPGQIPYLGGRQIVISGVHVGLKGCDAGTVIYASAVAGVPSINVTQCKNVMVTCPVRNITLDARQGQGGGTNNTATLNGDGTYTAVAHTNFVPGTVAMLIDNSFNMCVEGFGVTGYDQTLQLGAHAFCIHFEKHWFSGNNYGAGFISTSATVDSGEKMTWSNGTSSNNNRNVYFNFSNTSSDCNFHNLSSDYPNLTLVETDDSQGYNSTSSVTFDPSCHLETKELASGTGARVLNGGGSIRFIGSYCSEQSSNHPPVCFAQFKDASGASGSMLFDGVYFFGYQLPVCVQADTNQHDLVVTRCRYRYSNSVSVIAYSSPNGVRMQRDETQPAPFTANGGQYFTQDLQNKTIQWNSAAGNGNGGLVIPLDSRFNHEIGTTAKLVTTGPGGVALYVEAGVTVNGVLSPAAVYGPANSQGRTVDILKVGPNNWITHTS